ncbi:hypothetical protein Aperf_G00000021466 [Anoplocephala perfoliata]
MEATTTGEGDTKAHENKDANTEAVQNNNEQNNKIMNRKFSKPANDLRFSPSALTDLLDAFLSNGAVPESIVDKTLVLLRLSPTVLVDFDESSFVAVLLTAIEKSDEHTASRYLLLLSSLLSFSVSPSALRLVIDYIVSSGRTWRPYSYELIHQLKIASSFPNNMSFFVFPGEEKSWYMLTLAFVYNRWTKSELRCYVDGKIVSNVDMAWPISTSDSFERCVIGGSLEQREDNLFSGRIASITGFTEALSPQQISGLYALGPNYKGQLRFESEVRGLLTETERKALIESKLSTSVMFSYHPSACDHNLCLDQSPKPNPVFTRTPHGLMQGKVRPARTTSLQSALQSLGGIQLLYLLFEQLDYDFEDAVNSRECQGASEPFPVSALLFNLLFDLARTSYVLRTQLARTAGLVVFSQALLKSSSGRHLSDSFLNGIIEASRYLTSELLTSPPHAGATPTLLALFRQLFDKLLFAHRLWLRAPLKFDFCSYIRVGDKTNFSGISTVDHFSVSCSNSTGSVTAVYTLIVSNIIIGGNRSLVHYGPNLTRSSRYNRSHSSDCFIFEKSPHGLSRFHSTSSSAPTGAQTDTSDHPENWVPFDEFRGHRMSQVQECLYAFLADEFRVDLLGQSGKSIVASALHAIKYYFWIVKPAEPLLESTAAERPPLESLARIRSNLLLFVKPLILQQYQLNPTMTGSNVTSYGEEVDSLFNFLSTVKEPDNLRDVLFFTVALMEKYPAVMVPWFDRHDGIQCVFQLLGLPDEDCRLYALKMLGFFLKHSKPKQRQETVVQNGVFSHLSDRFLTVAPTFTMKTYNVFFELLTEDVSLKLTDKILPNPSPSHRIENSALLKTIALLIIHSKRTPELMTIRQAFLEHLLSLCLNSDANRRQSVLSTVRSERIVSDVSTNISAAADLVPVSSASSEAKSLLQMSVWQDWVIGLASLFPQNEQNSYATATVMEILRCLLFYALRFEYGGWRVWIDTLAILHSRITFEEFRRANHQQMRLVKKREDNQRSHSSTDRNSQLSQSGTPSDLADPSIPLNEKTEVENMDLTDRAVHKLVNEMHDQVVAEVDGSKEKAEERAENEPTAAVDPRGAAESDRDKINVHEQSQAKTAASKLQPSKQEQTQRQGHGGSNQEPEKMGVEAFRTPPFVWSYLHQILVDSVLRSIEDEFQQVSDFIWKYVNLCCSNGCQSGISSTSVLNTIAITSSPKDAALVKEKLETETLSSDSINEDEYDIAGTLAIAHLQAFINDPANHIYAINLIHLVSQLSDNLVSACGGLLPLLAATTSPTMELEIQEPSSGLSPETAFGFLLRVANIADVVVFMPASSVNLASLEKETGMNLGGIVRQCLRLACLCAVRNCLEARLSNFLPTPEILSQICTLPAPHHYFFHPLPTLSNSETGQLPHAPSTSVPTADLADASSSSLAAAAGRQSHPPPLSGFHFYSILRNKMEVIQRLANPIASNADLEREHLSSECVAFLERLRHLPGTLQRLVLGLRPSMANYPPGFMGGIFDKTVSNPLLNMDSLLQNVDINRLHNVIYRDEEETRQVHFVALAVIYFLSVLMVSKYRDLLNPVYFPALRQPEADPSPQPRPSISPAVPSLTSSASGSAIAIPNIIEAQEDAVAQPNESNSQSRTVSSQSSGDEANKKETVENDVNVQKPHQSGSEKDSVSGEKDIGNGDPIEHINSGDEGQIKVATIHQSMPKSTLPVSLATGKPTVCSVIGGADTTAESKDFPASSPSPPPTPPHLLPSPPPSTKSAPADLTGLLEHFLGSSVPLLKEIFFDFETFLGKTLIGSHGQDLLLTGGLTALRNSSLAVEIVMLLCSQEWQNSLQKHAGLAFIELVNECRLLAKASREHFISVAHEADFILARIRSSEVRRQTAFRATALRRQRRRVDELDSRQTRRLEAAGARDDVLAAHCLALTHHLLQCLQHAPLSSAALISSIANRNDGASAVSASAMLQQTRLFLERTRRPLMRVFYRLDTWEDDSRRRRRLVINPFGSSHPEAVLHSPPVSPSSPPNTAAIIAIDTRALNLQSQSEQQQQPQEVETLGSRKMSVDSQQQIPSTPLTSGSPFIPAEPGLAPGLISMHQDSFTFGQLEIDPLSSTVLTTPCQLIAPGVAVNGTLSVTNTTFAFETDPSDEVNQKIDPQVLAYTGNLYSRWYFSEIRAVFTRRHLLRHVALEIFLTTRSSVMFALPDEPTVRRVVYALPPVGIGIRYGAPQSHRISLAPGQQHFSLSQATQRWQRREMSNFDYLMCLNTLAGRSFNDLNQYPIFPWVLSNYTSSHLDLNEPANYRDLSKPVGALSPARKAFFDERYAGWDDPTQPAFHYGTHYSTAAFVLNYLIRLEPFTTMFLNMQGGKFDHPNRLFYSVAAAWTGCLETSTNVKELIPEFFYLPEMFENTNGYDLGTLEDGTKLGDVELPPWASSPEEFVRIHRQALESDLVSCQLHHWIDLIFGYKQRGPEAVKATNVFHYLTYEGSVNWDKVTDPVMREALEGQIACFGQTPTQLLTTPHPPRGSALAACPRLFAPPVHEVAARLRPLSHAPLLGLFFVLLNNDVELIGISANCVFTVNKWNRAVAATTVAADSSNEPTRRKMSKTISPAAKSSTEELKETPLEARNETPLAPQSISSPSPNFPASATLPVRPVESQAMPLLTLDPTPFASNMVSNKRYIGENMDPSVRLSSNNFVVTADGRAVVACGYFDYSFRIFAVNTGQCVQSIVGGHQDVVTCLGLSESNGTSHCYLASGGRDGLVCLWILNVKALDIFSESLKVRGKFGSQLLTSMVETHLYTHHADQMPRTKVNHLSLLPILNLHGFSKSYMQFVSLSLIKYNGATATLAVPMPYATLVGHQNSLQCIAVSAELGLVFSGSEDGVCLLHTTHGELLRRFEVPQTTADRLRPCGVFNGVTTAVMALGFRGSPMRVMASRHGYVIFQLGAAKLAVFTLNARLVAITDLYRQIRGGNSSSENQTGTPPSSPSSSSSASPVMISPSRDLTTTGSCAGDDGSYNITALAVTRSAEFVCVGGNDGLVSILHLYSLRLLHSLPRCKAPITALDLSPDQRHIVVGLLNGGLVVFNVNFNRWSEDIRDEGIMKDQQPGNPLRTPLKEVAEEGKDTESHISSHHSDHPNPPVDVSHVDTATTEQEESKLAVASAVKSAELLSQETEAVCDEANSPSSS